MNDTQLRIQRGRELADLMTEDQLKAVNDACERVRMGKSGFWHELAELVVERDARIDTKELREKMDELKGTFDGFAYDNGAGSSGWNQAIDKALELFPETE